MGADLDIRVYACQMSCWGERVGDIEARGVPKIWQMLGMRRWIALYHKTNPRNTVNAERNEEAALTLLVHQLVSHL